MSHDELIRRALLHSTPRVARPGYAVGGNPGDLATGGFGTGISGRAATAREMAAAVDRGNAMAAGRQSDGPGTGPVGGTANRAGVNVTYNGQPVVVSPAGDTNVPMDDFRRTSTQMQAAFSPTGFRGTPGSQPISGSVPSASFNNASINPNAVDSSPAKVLDYGQNVRVPDQIALTEAIKTPNPLLDPNKFNFTNFGVMSGMTPETLSKLVAMQDIYGKTLSIGPHGGYRDPEMNALAGGAPHSQHLLGQAVDVTSPVRTPAETALMKAAAQQAGMTGLGTYNNPGLLHMDIGPARSWGPDVGTATLAKAVSPAASPIQTGAKLMGTPSVYEAAATPIANAYAATAQANAIAAAQKAGIQSYGYNLPGFENQATVTTASTQPNSLGQKIAAIQKTLEAYNKLTPAQRTAWRAANPGVIDNLSADLSALKEKYQGTISVNEPLPEGYKMVGSGAYNVPAPGMISGYTNYSGVTFGLPKSVKTTETVTATNPMARIAAPGYGADVAPVVAQGVAGRGVGMQPSALQAAYGQLAAPTQVANVPSFQTYGRGTMPSGVVPSQAVVDNVQPASTVAPAAPQGFVEQLLAALKPGPFSGSLYDQGGSRGEARGEPNVQIQRYQNRELLKLGYTPEQIAAMSPEERAAILEGKTPAPTTEPVVPTTPVVAATGGRINYAEGGNTTTKPGMNEKTKNSKNSFEPLTLQPLPAWQPYVPPTYNMPSASPLIANFVSSLGQPIPAAPVQQYQSMAAPLQNWEASFANPAMGTSATSPSWGVNAMRYNPMLMDERPDYALVNNDSVSNALRLAKG